MEQKGALEIRLTNDLYNRIIVVEYICVLISAFGMGLSVILIETKNSKNHEAYEFVYQFYSLFCTIALIVAQYFKYNIYLKWYVSRNLISEHDTLLTTGWWKKMIFEMLLMLLAPYPFMQDIEYTEYVDAYDTYINYQLNDILLCFSFIRIYLFLRCALVVSPFMNPRSKRVCYMNGTDASLLFAIKAYMKQRPYVAITISVIVTIVVFGYMLRIFEGPISEASKQDFTKVGNCMWCVVVTLATVGYGEFYMKTTLGRLVGVFSCFWGTFIVSYFVVTVTNMLSFLTSEERSYTLLLRLHYKEELKRYAVNVLSSAFRHKYVSIKEPESEHKILRAHRRMRANTL